MTRSDQQPRSRTRASADSPAFTTTRADGDSVRYSLAESALGALAEATGIPVALGDAVGFVDGCLSAYEFRPTRAEPLADLARSLHVSAADFEHAAEIARRFGFPLDPQIEERILALDPEHVTDSDMRTLLASDAPRAQTAIDLFVYRIGRELGSLAAALQVLLPLIGDADAAVAHYWRAFVAGVTASRLDLAALGRAPAPRPWARR